MSIPGGILESLKPVKFYAVGVHLCDPGTQEGNAEDCESEVSQAYHTEKKKNPIPYLSNQPHMATNTQWGLGILVYMTTLG